jgi:hypothetical protein
MRINGGSKPVLTQRFAGAAGPKSAPQSTPAPRRTAIVSALADARPSRLKKSPTNLAHCGRRMGAVAGADTVIALGSSFFG